MEAFVLTMSACRLLRRTGLFSSSWGLSGTKLRAFFSLPQAADEPLRRMILSAGLIPGH